MDKFYLQLNAVNVITVTIMWLIGFFLIGLIAAAIQSRRNGDA